MKNDKPIFLILCTILIAISYIFIYEINSMSKEIIFTEKAFRKIPVQYAKKVVNNTTTYLSSY